VKTKSDKSNVHTVAQCRLACTQLPIGDVWRVPHRLIFPERKKYRTNSNTARDNTTRDNTTTNKDQYETKLVIYFINNEDLRTRRTS
jgi:hypothetical protein